jgi:signal transduction histidine kinase
VTATGRAILGLFITMAFLLGPYAPVRSAEVLVAGNLVWSLVLFAASRSRTMVYRLLGVGVPITVIDLGLFTALLYLTSGADSPFFSAFIVLILSATIQWGTRGAVLMGLAALAAFAPAGWQLLFGDERGPQAAQAFVLRVGYTGIISVMLAAFGSHVERVVQELSRLSDPLAEAGSDAAPPIEACLRHALWVFGAERGLFLWEEADEPYATVTIADHGACATRELPPGADDWVAAEAADAVFLFQRDSGACFVRLDGRTRRGPARPLAPALMALAPFEQVLVIPASTRGLNGWILVFDHREPATEDLAIGAMVSAQVAVALDRWESQRTRRETEAAEDRLRLGRDLHDGVLQFLAGAGLQLDGLGKADLPDHARARIATLRQAIADEQRELRGFIATLRPARADSRRLPLGEELAQLAERLSFYWTVEVAAEVAPADLAVSERVRYDLSRIVRESVANAVRHGGARKVRVTARGAEERLTLRIDDDGRGFAFEGERSAEQLERQGGAPRTLHERVRALNGRLELRSSAKGASVLIDVPLEAA